MKRIIFLSVFLHTAACSMAQTAAQYSLPQIGWSFTIPQGFTLKDSSTRTIKVSEHSIWNKRFVFTRQKDLFAAMLTTQPRDTSTDKEKLYTIEREESFETVSTQHPALRFDSLTTNISIGNLPFYKFTVTGKENNIPVFTHVEIHRFHKQYRFQIMYNVYSKETEAEIEKLLSDSKFVN